MAQDIDQDTDRDIDSITTWGKKVRHLGSAHSGVGAARLMHVTSLALMPLGIAFVWILAMLSHRDYAGARALVGSTVPAILMLLFVTASIWHMQVGMRSIIDDYVHDRHIKELALIANLFFSIVLALACIYSVLRMSFA